jgi:polysaccharide export outer membrane protein
MRSGPVHRRLLTALAAPLRSQRPRARSTAVRPPTASPRPHRPPCSPPTAPCSSRAVHDLQLSPGDLISVRLFGQPDYTPHGAHRHRRHGDAAAHRRDRALRPHHHPGRAAHRTEAPRSGGFYRDPQVTVQLVEGPNAVITVVGEAHGNVTVTGSRRLLDIISTVGGLPGTASHVITIHRPGVDQPIVIDLGTDPMHSAWPTSPSSPATPSWSRASASST